MTIVVAIRIFVALKKISCFAIVVAIAVVTTVIACFTAFATVVRTIQIGLTCFAAACWYYCSIRLHCYFACKQFLCGFCCSWRALSCSDHVCISALSSTSPPILGAHCVAQANTHTYTQIQTHFYVFIQLTDTHIHTRYTEQRCCAFVCSQCQATGVNAALALAGLHYGISRATAATTTTKTKYAIATILVVSPIYLLLLCCYCRWCLAPLLLLLLLLLVQLLLLISHMLSRNANKLPFCVIEPPAMSTGNTSNSSNNINNNNGNCIVCIVVVDTYFPGNGCANVCVWHIHSGMAFCFAQFVLLLPP